MNFDFVKTFKINSKPEVNVSVASWLADVYNICKTDHVIWLEVSVVAEQAEMFWYSFIVFRFNYLYQFFD